MATVGSIAFSEDQRDCLQEVVNVAMGQAGDSLARFLKVFINLSIPQVELVRRAELPDALGRLVGAGQRVSAVRQGFYSNEGHRGLRGESFMIFSAASFLELAEVLGYDEEPSEQLERELLLDVANVLNGACITGLADQLGTELDFSAPSLIGQRITVDAIVTPENLKWEYSLMVKINYAIQSNDFHCDLLMMMPDHAILKVRDTIDSLLDDL